MSPPSDSSSSPKAMQKHVLYSEILSVTSIMRKNSRWAATALFKTTRSPHLGNNMGLRISSPSYTPQKSGKSRNEDDLLAGFVELKRIISDIDDVTTMDLTVILRPFLSVLRSSLSTGPITSAALSALHNFHSSGLISPASPSLDSALKELSNAISQCKFEASDSSGDEVVLLKILVVIRDCVCGHVGRRFGDVEVCDMLETVLTTCCQMRLSEVLRQSAENTMQSLVKTVFSVLHSLEDALDDRNTPDEEELKMTIPSGDISDICVVQETGPASEPPMVATVKLSDYGLPSITELLRVLIHVLDPYDQQHTDSTRLVALRLLNTAFQVSGSSIAEFPSLRALVIDSGCKFLFQLARSENQTILQSALVVISAVFDTMRTKLKLQHELFLMFTIDRLALPPPASGRGQLNIGGRGSTGSLSPAPEIPSASPRPDVNELGKSFTFTSSRAPIRPARGNSRNVILETLCQISRHPSFMVDLYTNYDCDINCENVCERFIDFLIESVYPPSDQALVDFQQRNTQYLALELLLSAINSMAVRADAESEPWPPFFLSIDSLRRTKSQKSLILTGAARFNARPKDGLSFFEENKFIYADLSEELSKAHSLAFFLKNCPKLDKRLLGDFISKPENIDILKAFIGLFEFKNKPIADAMRELLEAFRLPGEAQQISRITEVFASTYFASGPDEIKSEDAVYVLAYSLIMLNTDLHNPQIRKRMSIEDYQRNLKGVNAGSDFSPEFLHTIYESIRKHEIILPEEHTGQLGFEYAWKELLARARQAGDYMTCNTTSFDKDLFRMLWKPIISAITFAFTSFDDDYIVQKTVSGFRQCATLGGHFQLPDVLDFVVTSLAQVTGLLADSSSSRAPARQGIEVEGQSVTVSRLSVEFGKSFKGQLAAIVLFNIVNGHGNALREGWRHIFEMYTNLFLNSLLPASTLALEDFLSGASTIPLRGSHLSQQVQSRGDGGLLSTLSSYLMTPYSSPSESYIPNLTESDIESTMCAIDCLSSCRLDEFWLQTRQLNSETFIAVLCALEALASERTVEMSKCTVEEFARVDSQPLQLPYDPASVFLLETMVSVTCYSPQYIEESWPIVFKHLSTLVHNSAQYSDLLIERAVVGLLRLCRILVHRPALREHIFLCLDLFARLPSAITSTLGEQIVEDIAQLIRKHRDTIRSPTDWKLVLSSVRSMVPHPEAAKRAFDLISSMIIEGPEQLITLDNFSSLTALLDEFATAAMPLAAHGKHPGSKVETLTTTSSPVVQRGYSAIDMISTLYRQLKPLSQVSQLPEGFAWRQLTLPLFISLGRQCLSPLREIRHNAMAQLQRILLGPQIGDIEQGQVEDIFNRVLFPLLDDLLKPRIYQRDPKGMPETRLRSCALICKAFMHLQLSSKNKTADFRLTWVQVLDLLDRLMTAEKGDQLPEAVTESLKNVLLVMNATEVLVPPETDGSSPEHQRILWESTHERLERFLPGFLVYVIPIPGRVDNAPSS